LSRLRGSPHWLARQAPKHVPLFLVADRSAADSDRIRSDQLSESRKRWIPRIDGEGESEITCSVFMPDVGDSGVWERGETFECVVHLCACTFKEDATACDEERVAREDGTGGLGDGHVGHVVADGVLGVARSCETLDVECFADGKLIVAFDQSGQSGTLMAAPINRYAWKQSGKLLVSATVVVVVMRRDPRDDFETELVRCFLDFRRRVRVHGSGLIRGVVYDEIRVIVLPDGDWNDSHVVVGRGVEGPLSCFDRERPEQRRASG